MKKTFKTLWAGIALASAATALADRAGAADLTVEITNIRTAEGSIMIAVYDKEDAFLSDDGMKTAVKLAASTEGVSHTFSGLAAGSYAISVFHDVDADGELDTNFMGIPKEPIGMSRDARGQFGPPKFKDAVFRLSGEGGKQKIHLD